MITILCLQKQTKYDVCKMWTQEDLPWNCTLCFESEHFSRYFVEFNEPPKSCWTSFCIESGWTKLQTVKLYNVVFCLEGEDKGTTENVLVLEQSLCDMKCLAGLWECLQNRIMGWGSIFVNDNRDGYEQMLQEKFCLIFQNSIFSL